MFYWQQEKYKEGKKTNHRRTVNHTDGEGVCVCVSPTCFPEYTNHSGRRLLPNSRCSCSTGHILQRSPSASGHHSTEMKYPHIQILGDSYEGVSAEVNNFYKIIADRTRAETTDGQLDSCVYNSFTVTDLLI